MNIRNSNNNNINNLGNHNNSKNSGNIIINIKDIIKPPLIGIIYQR